MSNYKVKTNEEFFNEFKEKADTLRMLGGMFQNEGLEISQEQRSEYARKWANFMFELGLFRSRAFDRIKVINN